MNYYFKELILNTTMTYIAYHFPTRTFPKEITEIREGFYAFRSNTINENNALYSGSTCLIIDTNIYKNEYLNLVIDYITILNVFRQEFVSVQWLNHIHNNKLETFTNFNEYVDIHLKEEKSFGDEEDFRNMEVWVLTNEMRYSFIDVLNSFINLKIESFEKRTIQFLAINNPIIMTTNKIFDNALFESAMLIQTFEAILNEYYPILIEDEGLCANCNRKSYPGLRNRTKVFLESKNYIQKDTKSALIQLIENRNTFFHYLKGKTHIQYVEQTVEKTGRNDISFKNEIEYANGIIQAPSILKYIIIKEMFDKIVV